MTKRINGKDETPADMVPKDFLDQILDNMLDPLIVLEKKGRIRLVNRAVLELLNYSSSELVGREASLLFTNATHILEQIDKDGLVKNVELQLRSKSGRKIPVILSASCLPDHLGHFAGTILVAKDITDRKKLEYEMLQSEKLSAVGRLASGVAHEINNPLGVILGFAQGALWDLSPGDPLEMPLRSIERESKRCRNLVQDLLTFSRESKTDREPVDLNKTVESVFSLIAAQARLGNVLIIKDLNPNLPHILANQNQIEQVIINLANNALDALNREGSLTIETSLKRDGGRPWACFLVRDSGRGIPPSVLPRIFEPFFTTKSGGQCAGIGLGLVHEIVKRHSATIEVQSVPGCTEFLVKFPVQVNVPKESVA